MGKAQANRRGNGERARHRPRRPGADIAAKPSDLVSSKVIRLANILRRSSTLVYGRRFGLSHVEWRIVALVGEHAPLSLNALAEFMGLDRGQTSRGVSALVARRVVLREYRRDGRGLHITLTARGVQIYGGLMNSARERNGVLLRGMSAAETRGFFDVLDRLTGLATAILERERNSH
ncbi:MAG: MarR family transcriptional regulator [Xanthobacteraceae bacterium]